MLWLIHPGSVVVAELVVVAVEGVAPYLWGGGRAGGKRQWQGRGKKPKPQRHPAGAKPGNPPFGAFHDAADSLSQPVSRESQSVDGRPGKNQWRIWKQPPRRGQLPDV